MQPFTRYGGIVVPMDRVNVDTDQIVPKQFLKLIERTGFGKYLFYDWRFSRDGKPNQEFVLNSPRYKEGKILLARANFGCGSSREHAVWALSDYGFRALIAPSYADIFYNNCFKNGVLPIKVSRADLKKLLDDAERGANATLTIDLPAQEIRGPDGGVVRFEIDPFRKRCLIEGLDDIGLTLIEAAAIEAHEKKKAEARPWL